MSNFAGTILSIPLMLAEICTLRHGVRERASWHRWQPDRCHYHCLQLLSPCRLCATPCGNNVICTHTQFSRGMRSIFICASYRVRMRTHWSSTWRARSMAVSSVRVLSQIMYYLRGLDSLLAKIADVILLRDLRNNYGEFEKKNAWKQVEMLHKLRTVVTSTASASFKSLWHGCNVNLPTSQLYLWVGSLCKVFNTEWQRTIF